MWKLIANIVLIGMGLKMLWDIVQSLTARNDIDEKTRRCLLGYRVTDRTDPPARHSTPAIPSPTMAMRLPREVRQAARKAAARALTSTRSE